MTAADRKPVLCSHTVRRTCAVIIEIDSTWHHLQMNPTLELFLH
jgi:hypothetical protein